MARAATAAIGDRRWERRPDDRPRLLMASALKLLKRRGYRRVRLEDVARDAGVCKATVYHYFASKDDLLTRSVANRMAEKREDVERRLEEAGGSASDRLRLFLHDYWTHMLTSQAALWQRLIVGEVAIEAPDVFAAWANGLVEQWKAVATLIREGQASGEFGTGADAEVAARLIMSALAHQAMFHVHLGLSRFAPCGVERIFDSSLQLLLHGLRPRRAAKRR